MIPNFPLWCCPHRPIQDPSGAYINKPSDHWIKVFKVLAIPTGVLITISTIYTSLLSAEKIVNNDFTISFGVSLIIVTSAFFFGLCYAGYKTGVESTHELDNENQADRLSRRLRETI